MCINKFEKLYIFVLTLTAVKGTQNYARAWDNDYVLIGHCACPFVRRGGNCNTGFAAGVFCSYISGGDASDSDGFRSVLVV